MVAWICQVLVSECRTTWGILELQDTSAARVDCLPALVDTPPQSAPSQFTKKISSEAISERHGFAGYCSVLLSQLLGAMRLSMRLHRDY